MNPKTRPRFTAVKSAAAKAFNQLPEHARNRISETAKSLALRKGYLLPKIQREKVARKELKRLQVKFEEIRKSTLQLDNFVRHDIIAPTHNAESLADNLLSKISSNPKQVFDYFETLHRYLLVVKERVNRAKQGVTFLSKPIEFGKLFESFRTITEIYNARGHELNLLLESNLTKNNAGKKFFADQNNLLRAFENLVINTGEHNLGKSNKMQKLVKVTVKILLTDGRLNISVSDNGNGMTPEQIQKFNAGERFSGKDSSSKFHGFGLTTVREIVKQHGGTVKVESELGKGTTFFIEIPVS